MSIRNSQAPDLAGAIAETEERRRSNMQSTAFYIRPDQVARLRELSKRTKVSQAEYVRQALDLLFGREKV